MLYFFYGKGIAYISHGYKKGGKGGSKKPEKEIDLAIKHRTLLNGDRERHTATFEA